MAAAHRDRSPMMTIAEVSRVYGIKRQTLYLWIEKGLVGHVLVGPCRTKRIPRDEARRLFQTRPSIAQ